MSAREDIPIEVAGEHWLEIIARLRARVWRETGACAADAFPDGTWRDELDPHCRHWVVLHAGVALAAARLSVHASLDDVPEAAQYRGFGLASHAPIGCPGRVVVASALVDAQHAAMCEMGVRLALRQAAPEMIPLLTRRGWRILGPASPDPMFPGVVFSVAALELAPA